MGHTFREERTVYRPSRKTRDQAKRKERKQKRLVVDRLAGVAAEIDYAEAMNNTARFRKFEQIENRLLVRL